MILGCNLGQPYLIILHILGVIQTLSLLPAPDHRQREKLLIQQKRVCIRCKQGFERAVCILHQII